MRQVPGTRAGRGSSFFSLRRRPRVRRRGAVTEISMWRARWTWTSGSRTWEPSYTLGSERIRSSRPAAPITTTSSTPSVTEASGRDPHARAVAAGVRDHDRRGAHLERGAVEDEGVRRGGERRERTHRGIGVLQPPRQPVRPVGQLGGVRVDAGVRRPGDHAGAAVRQAELDQVDRGRSSRQQHPGHLGGVVGEAEHPGEVVAAAGRHDAERPAQRGHLAGDGRQHPVAADRDHDVAAGDGGADQVEGGQRSGRVRHLDGRARLAQQPGHRDDRARGGAAPESGLTRNENDRGSPRQGSGARLVVG